MLDIRRLEARDDPAVDDDPRPGRGRRGGSRRPSRGGRGCPDRGTGGDGRCRPLRTRDAAAPPSACPQAPPSVAAKTNSPDSVPRATSARPTRPLHRPAL